VGGAPLATCGLRHGDPKEQSSGVGFRCLGHGWKSGGIEAPKVAGNPVSLGKAAFAAGCAHGGPEGPHFFFVGCEHLSFREVCRNPLFHNFSFRFRGFEAPWVSGGVFTFGA
jgi:hypothetical protein